MRFGLLFPALLLCASSAGAHAQQTVHRFTVAPQGNEARYLVQEQLAGFDLPNDAVGRTAAVSGRIAVTGTGTVLRDSSHFTIDAASLTTDRDRRDNYVRRNTLQTEANPTIVFVPTSIEGLPFPLPASGGATFRMVGDLTIRGVTRPVTWDMVAQFVNGSIRGDAKTQFSFAEFEMTKPSVRSVLSVADDIRLEYTFFLVPATE
ncbi:MAG: YceI family protein [Gemmatimonadota bacterium]